MHYWIDNNGEKLGPMRAIDVLRRAQAPTRVYDGENWFYLDEGQDLASAAGSDSKQTTGERVTIRNTAS
jgi:hypothetical protein